jgi:hypothetical protein
VRILSSLSRFSLTSATKSNFRHQVQKQIKDLKGPSLKEKWWNWTHATDEQRKRSATINELEKMTKAAEVSF